MKSTKPKAMCRPRAMPMNSGQYGEVNRKTSDDKNHHGNEVHPVSEAERSRMGLTVVCEMCHLTSPPRAGYGLELLAGPARRYAQAAQGVEAVNGTQRVDRLLHIGNGTPMRACSNGP